MLKSGTPRSLPSLHWRCILVNLRLWSMQVLHFMSCFSLRRRLVRNTNKPWPKIVLSRTGRDTSADFINLSCAFCKCQKRNLARSLDSNFLYFSKSWECFLVLLFLKTTYLIAEKNSPKPAKWCFSIHVFYEMLHITTPHEFYQSNLLKHKWLVCSSNSLTLQILNDPKPRRAAATFGNVATTF